MNQQIEQAKISLSAQTQTQIVLFCQSKQLQMPITRNQFNSWVKDIIEKTRERTIRTVEDAKLSFSDIDEVYAVGGGSMMPLIVEALEKTTGKKISKRCESHSVVALGTVLAGQINNDNYQLPVGTICVCSCLSVTKNGGVNYGTEYCRNR